MGPHYFAYGSNLTRERMRERVPSSTPLGVARLAEHRLTWDKPGADGSGKANIVRATGSVVWGVVYRLEPEEWQRLDAHEPGYERIRVEVLLARERIDCTTYLHPGAADVAPPFDWYRDLVVGGAREHGLPDDYVRALEAVRSRVDPRR